jgi:alpha,alpha-trehalase
VIEENYQRDGTIREKYNMVTRSSETALTGGYKANVIGFGWTNGVYLGFVEPSAKAVGAR